MNKFNFWIPIEKSVKKKSGKDDEMILEGIASTSSEDLDGEFLDPAGFDLSYFKESGLVNYHHQSSQSPSSIIGEPIESRITPEGLYVKVRLYNDNPLAREVYETTKMLQNSSKSRRMGFSIEGQAQERDEKNPKRINRAKITGLAITYAPKNSDTFAEIVKGLQLVKTIDSQVPIKRESLNKELKKIDVYKSIFSTFLGINLIKARKIFNIIKSINGNEMEITEEAIEKAYQILGIKKGSDSKKMRKEEPDGDESDEEPDGDEFDEEMKKSMDDDDEETPPSMTKSQYMKHKAACEAYEKNMSKSGSKKIEKGFDDELVKSVKELTKLVRRQSEKIEILEEQSQGRRSISKGVTVERFETEPIKKSVDSKTVNQSDFVKTRQLLDNLTFEKGGFDNEFGEGLQYFEANRILSKSTVSKLQSQGFTVNE